MKILNPFYIFIIGIVVSIILYRLQLSFLYSNIFTNIELLLLIFCFLSILFGFSLNSNMKKHVYICMREEKIKNSNIMFYFILLGAFLELANYGGIPLIDAIRGKYFDYQGFGIKTFHVFYLSSVYAYCVVSFYRYLIFKNKKLLFQCIICLLFSLLIINRGTLFFMIFSCFLMWVSQKKLNIRVVIITIFSLFVIILIFGYIGDQRMESSGYESEKVILKIGKADPFFDNVPTGFFWTYLYISSPLATLSNQEINDNYGKSNFDDFVIKSIIPDFLSKHMSKTESRELRITEELNVGTGFFRPFIDYGYLGCILLFIYMVLIIFLFYLFNRNKCLMPILAILSTMTFFIIFVNTFIFSLFILTLIMITVFSRLKLGKYYLI